jgi:serine/threonine-protein kinase
VPPTDPPKDPDRIATLIARGDYAEAAAALRAQGAPGDLQRAQQLYERIWDFRAAAAIAHDRGDQADELRLLLQAGDAAEAERLHGRLLRAPAAAQRAAEQIYEDRRLFTQAAQLAEARGDLPRARDLCARAGDLMQVGRLSERLGELREAGSAYERALREGGDDEPGPHLGLARILGCFGQHEEAIRHLQRARRMIVQDGPGPGRPEEDGPEGDQGGPRDGTLQALDRALAHHLSRAGLPGVARRVLARYPAPAAARSGVAAPEPPPALPAPPVPGAEAVLLGRYALLRLLGSGGMGRVYLARDLLLDRQVALKLVPPPPGILGQAHEREGYARFAREAQVLRGLRHPGLLRVLDVHPEEGVLVMEYMAGGALGDRPLPLAQGAARRVLLQVLGGLQAAHSAGVIHRDIKPQNIFFGLTGEARLGDFGAAHLQQLGATQTAGFVGTLAYMSPEQITGDRPSFATDIYALGVLAFQLVTGRLPFAGPDFVAQHLGEAPPAPTSLRPGLHPGWDAICARAMAKAPQDRFESLSALHRALAAMPLPEDDAARRGASQTEEAAPQGSLGGSGPGAEEREMARYREDALFLETAWSVLRWGTDLRLGRQVLIEDYAAAALSGPAGAAQLRWLRLMARHGGPGLQRVLRIDLSGLSGPRARVIYEAPRGHLLQPGEALRGEERAVLERVLRGLAQEGGAHGAVAGSVLREESGVLLLVAGRGPLLRDGHEGEDLRDLQRCHPPAQAGRDLA